MKRQPTLADKFLQSHIEHLGITKHQVADVRDNLMQAKRFILDEQAALYIAEMVKETPRIIADAQDFAIPPFAKTWIEFPFAPFWESVNGFKSSEHADDTLGFLITGNRVRIVVGGKNNSTPSLMPHEYHLWSPMTVQEELQLVQRVQTSRGQLDYIFWGSSIDKLRTEQDKEGLHALRENHRIHFPEKNLQTAQLIWHEIVMQSGGDLRNIIAILLFLNRTREIQIVDDVPHARGIIKNKASTFLSYHRVTLKLNPGPLLKKLVPGEGTWKRLHDVRGHFCHDKRSREAGTLWCSHDWMEYEPLKWVCDRCKGKRWWRSEHKRGHEEKGIILSEYNVVK